MSTTDQLLQNNDKYQADFAHGNKPMPPARKVAIVACMDARIHPTSALGLQVA